MENNDLIVNIPCFRKNYFKIGEAIRIKFTKINSIVNGMITDIERERIHYVVEDLDTAICGSGYKPMTRYIMVDDVTSGRVEINRI